MSNNVIELNDSNFNEYLSNDKPILVDFWAEWCGPCKMLTPTIDELADEYANKIVIGKLNVDEHPSIASEYGIRSIPSLLFFKDGKVQNQIMGAVSKNDIAKTLDGLIE
jgi:thioredoxin 1